MSPFQHACQQYADLGVDAAGAIDAALAVPISIHCWQGDDVTGFEPSLTPGGGILATGSWPGRATSPEELRAMLDAVLRSVPGQHRLNLHAIYAETGGQPAARTDLAPEHFHNWMEWARTHGISLDFNPTYFAHPKAADGMTLSHPDAAVRDYWVAHGRSCREIARAMAAHQGGQCVLNHWIPDGAKDSPADRWSPRARLTESLDRILEGSFEGCTDSVESKLFGLGSEDYVVGSFEYYSHYALRRGVLLCLDMGHFHPTETISDKLSALLQFHSELLLHLSRPMRWDSDHVTLFNDDLRAVFQELVRGAALGRVRVALDYFDASIDRTAAYVIGIRAARKALLYALLEPVARLQELERQGQPHKKLALMEDVKTLPFGAVWAELCERQGMSPRLAV